LLAQVEEEFVSLIKASFIDNGRQIEEELEFFGGRELTRVDSDNELSIFQDNKVSEWQVNQ